MAPWKSRTQMGPQGTGKIFFFFSGRDILKEEDFEQIKGSTIS